MVGVEAVSRRLHMDGVERSLVASMIAGATERCLAGCHQGRSVSKRMWDGCGEPRVGREGGVANEQGPSPQ